MTKLESAEKEKEEPISSAAEAAKTMRTNLYLDDTYGTDNLYSSIGTRLASSPKVMLSNSISIKSILSTFDGTMRFKIGMKN